MSLFSTKTAPAEHYPVERTDEEWARTLTPEQFRVLRKHGTERAGSSPLVADGGDLTDGTPVRAGPGVVAHLPKVVEHVLHRSRHRTTAGGDRRTCRPRGRSRPAGR